jgi:hypothetical protein
MHKYIREMKNQPIQSADLPLSRFAYFMMLSVRIAIRLHAAGRG